MSFVIAEPEMVASAASDLARLGSMIGAANAAAAPPTTGVVAAASDEVSAAVAALFSGHAQGFQFLSAQAAAFHQRFVQLMNGSAAQYVSSDAANASPMTALPAVPSLGYGNTGANNWGFFNTGTNNLGIGNTGNFNAGIGNMGDFNFGIGNVSPNLSPNLNNITALGGVGAFNNGFNNFGIGNVGDNNQGLPLPLFVGLFGVGNHGSFDSGLFNFGIHDSGIANFGNYLYGVGLTGNNQFGIGPLSIPYPFPPLPMGISYPFGLL